MAAPSEHPPGLETPLVIVRPSTLQDMQWIAPRLRKADRQEILASSGQGPLDNLLRALYTGKLVFTAIQDGLPAAVFGTTDLIPVEDELVAWVWMVGTDQLTVKPKNLLRTAKQWLPTLSLGAAACMNFVDSRNKQHINWLEHMGFEINKEEGTTLADPRVTFFPFTKEMKTNSL